MDRVENILGWLKKVTVEDQNDYDNDIEYVENYIKYLEKELIMACPPHVTIEIERQWFDEHYDEIIRRK